MAVKGKNQPFFFSINTEITENNKAHQQAKDKLIARDPVFYKKTMFRAFLQLTKEECDNMDWQEYLDYSIMLEQYLLLLHAPFQRQN